jgi:hypothetical protein
MSDGDTVEEAFLVADKQLRANRNGNLFLQVELRDRTGSIIGRGDNSEGQLNVPPGISNAFALAAGGTHSLALKTTGEVLTWGDDLYDESVSDLILPGASAVAAGAYHNLILISSPAGALFLSNPTRSGQTFTVSFATIPGKSYLLQYKNSLNDAAWTSLSSIPGTGGIRTLTDPFATPNTRFYRVSVSP